MRHHFDLLIYFMMELPPIHSDTGVFLTTLGIGSFLLHNHALQNGPTRMMSDDTKPTRYTESCLISGQAYNNWLMSGSSISLSVLIEIHRNNNIMISLCSGF